MPTYTIAELAKLADVTPRTVRFYISQGLLPSPGQQGPGTQYSDEHLERLRLIKRLQATYLPLAEIRTQIRTMTGDELAAAAEAPAPAPGAAIDYIRGVLHRPSAGPLSAASMPAPSLPSPTPTPAPESTRSQWERIPLDPDVELHVRRPLTRQTNKRVERLITIAREIFEED